MADQQAESNGECEQPMEQEEPYERTEQFQKLVDAGLDEAVAEELDKKLYASGLLVDGDLDERALDAMKEFDLEGAKKVIADFSTSKLAHVTNKSAYLCGVMKIQRQKSKDTGKPQEEQRGPDEAKLNAILERTGYSLDVTTGQRKYGGPPPNWEGSQPGAGHEVFFAKVPKDMFEDELIPVFEKAGEIWDLRLMIEPMSKLNRGYGFVTYCTKEAAQNAKKTLDGYEIAPGKNLKVNVSIANVRLFVGNIPKSKSKEEIQEEFSALSEELEKVIVYGVADDPKKKNRGFAFLEYLTHKGASAAKRKLGSGRTKVWGCDIIVDWADPLSEPDESTMATVKVLYVRGLSSEVTEDVLKEKFEPYGKVERVKKVKDYGFVHFEDREHALQAMNDLNGQKLGAGEMEISLAKPPQDNKKKEMRKMNRGRGFEFGGGPPFMHGGFGGFGGHGGYDEGYGYGGGMGYRGGYNDGYDDYGSGGYYDFYRGRGRGGQGRGGARGMRGMGGGRGGPRGGRGGMRGGPRGGGGMRGGFGMGQRAGKRKFGGDNQQQPKRRFTDQSWGTQPIPQQPIDGGYANNDASQWYQDSYTGGSW